MSGSDSVLHRFDRAAAGYHAAATIQRRVAERLMDEVKAFPVPFRILEVGCGSGQLTERLVHRFPNSFIDAIDTSSRMIREATRRLDWAPNVACAVADIRRLKRRGQYDLAISSSALHWATPITTAIRRMAIALSERGRFAVSLMTEGTLAELHQLRAHISPAKIPAARLPAFVSVREAVQAAGLHLVLAQESRFETSHASALIFLGELRAMGVTGGIYSRGSMPLNRKELSQLAQRYQSEYGDSKGQVHATWRMATLLAQA